MTFMGIDSMNLINLIAKGREIGLTPSQVREIIKEQRELIRREALMQDVLSCNNLEDIKILLLDWIDKGYVK
jgi:predicted RNA-binding protein with PUA domain